LKFGIINPILALRSSVSRPNEHYS